MRKIFTAILCLLCLASVTAQERVHSFGADLRAGYMLNSTNNLVFGNQTLDSDGKPVKPERTDIMHSITSFHARYSFAYTSESRLGRLYPGAYQGAGVSLTSFFNHKAIGTPVSLYVFQGSPIKHFSPRLSFGYEWNFGISAGWHKSDMEHYPLSNIFVGSRFNAYINVGFVLDYRLSESFTLRGGVEMTHFSDGNTALPNPGINGVGARIGVVYTPSPMPGQTVASKETVPQRWSYDLLVYGAASKKAVNVTDDVRVAAPGHFGLAGISFSPMRTFNQYFRAGGALDLKYDNGSNLQKHLVEGSTRTDIRFTRRPLHQCLMAGISAHAELVMPLFSVNVGLGRTLLGVASNRKFYQQAHLRIRTTDRIWINIGYQLHSFQHPDNLILGMGYTFM